MTISATRRQMDALRFVRGYQLAKGYCPTFRGIAVGIGLSPKSKARVSAILDDCERAGLITRLRWHEQAIEVLTPVSIPRSPTGEPLWSVPGPWA